MNILLTGGGTWQCIDSVRYLANGSTGKTATYLAKRLAKRGHRVYFVHAHYLAPLKNKNIYNYSFISYDQLKQQMLTLLKNVSFKLVIHNAAVSDYTIQYLLTQENKRLKKLERGKVENLKAIYLQKTKKLLSLPALHKVCLMAFKLTATLDQAEQQRAIHKVLKNKNVDIVIHNDLHQISGKKHQFTLYFRPSLLHQPKVQQLINGHASRRYASFDKKTLPGATKSAMANYILKIAEQLI